MFVSICPENQINFAKISIELEFTNRYSSRKLLGRPSLSDKNFGIFGNKFLNLPKYSLSLAVPKSNRRRPSLCKKKQSRMNLLREKIKKRL